MRVDDRNLNGVAGPQSGRTQEPHSADALAPAPGTQHSGVAGSDRAEISSLASRISDVLTVNAAERTQRIAKLAQEFKQGRYSADSHATSHAVIQEALGRKDGAQ
jgi:hypothetical protein